jgi:Tol biopolymer transport system component
MRLTLILVTSIMTIVAGCAQPTPQTPPAPSPTSAAVPRAVQPDPQETHFGELVMLTDGGENAEAYFSFAGDRLVYQATKEGMGCDQIFTMKLDGTNQKMVSTGSGRTTCAYYYPGDDWIVYASTHLAGPDCPPVPDHSKGYVWPIYAAYDLFKVRPDGTDLQQLTDSPGYDAEATISPVGDRIVFTSMRDGDLDIYTMNLDGSDVRRLTDALGYDGGPFFSPDGAKIVYRANHPTDPQEIADYSALLADGLIRPSKLEIWIMNADGSDKRQITDLGAASFAPFFMPSGDRIIFSSNTGDPSGREFDLYTIGIDGEGLERITYSPEFDGFPMFAPDGTTFVFCSNRSNSTPGDTNVFLTRWID